MKFDSASFRDPDARVLRDEEGRILRALSARAAAVDQRLRAAGVIDELVRDGLLIESHPRPDLRPENGWTAMIESRRLPFVNYPYEWSFGMLQDAALLTLDLTRRALERGVALKDASAYNVVFAGARPVFIDVASLADYEDGTPWLAYGQFCDHFLAPLMLEAYRHTPFQPFLRGNLEGLSVSTQLAPLLAGRDWFRPGVLTHVKLRALLDRRTRGLATTTRREVRAVSLPRSAVLRNIASLRRIVTRLESGLATTWADYDATNTYDEAMVERKSAFVGRAAARAERRALAWDLGANTGRYSRLLARSFACVVAMDADPGAVERLYRALRQDPDAERVLPLVVDLMNPSPAQGWRGRERDGLLARGRPDLALHLALVHHLCLGQGVPLASFLDMVRETSPLAVVEFVAREDPMSQAVLATKVVSHPDYDLETFRALARERGEILEEETLSSTRTLLLLRLAG